LFLLRNPAGFHVTPSCTIKIAGKPLIEKPSMTTPRDVMVPRNDNDTFQQHS
jgi:hypothetical protein